MEPRISIVTLGVDDLDRAVAFYEAMGLKRNGRFTDGVAFFQMGGLILALWPREELARDAGVDEFIAKPVTAKALLARINSIVNHRRPFIRTGRYFGPDRRRKNMPFDGPEKRSDEN